MDSNIRILMSTQFVQCVRVQCICPTDDNCLTLENHPLGIVRTLIQLTQPLRLIYLFNGQRKWIQIILSPSVSLWYRVQDSGQHYITITNYRWRQWSWDHVWITCKQPILTMAVIQFKMGTKFHSYCTWNHFIFYLIFTQHVLLL